MIVTIPAWSTWVLLLCGKRSRLAAASVQHPSQRSRSGQIRERRADVTDATSRTRSSITPECRRFRRGPAGACSRPTSRT
jgi:hypothetical protein